jgi:ADP-heptose:LPS heptosyltransferase
MSRERRQRELRQRRRARVLTARKEGKVRGLLKRVRGVAKLGGIVLVELCLILRALVRGQWDRAADHTRKLAGIVHEDLVKVIVALQRVLPLWPPSRGAIDRILIVKLDRIGDMVNTTPVFDALLAAYPRARLDIVGHPGPLTLLDGDERIGERIAYQTWMYHPLPILPGGPRLWWRILKLLWRRYPLVIYLRGSFPLLWLGLTSRFLAARFVFEEPVVSRYLKALEPALGLVAKGRPRLHVPLEETRRARAILGEGSGPSVIIHAGASSGTKIWPAERFAALADGLAGTCAARVHFVGGADDRPRLRLIRGLAKAAHGYHTNLRLPRVSAVIAAADLFIGNDSGLSHIAAAVGTRLVVLWGSVNLSMARPEAAAGTCVILYHDLLCRDGCPESHCVNPSPLECLSRIRVEDVLGAARQMLPRSPHGSSLPVVSIPSPAATCRAEGIRHEESVKCSSRLI